MKLEADIDCPNCNHKMKIAVGSMRTGQSKRCPKCGANIKFSGDGHKAQKAVDDLEKSLKNMFK